jgi:hypothetical protein
LRSVFVHANTFVRYIYIVTNGKQAPAWLDLTHSDRIRVVDYTTLFAPSEVELPMFNTLAVESVLHRIPDLSPTFLYFTENVLLNKFTTIDDFYIQGM